MDGDLGFWVYVILYVLDIRRDRLAQSETARSSHAIMVIDVTGSVGDGGFPIQIGGVSYTIRILMYLDVSCMYLDCILMCPVRIHQDTSGYIKIHLYLSLWPSDTFKIQCILTLRYMTHKIQS